MLRFILKLLSNKKATKYRIVELYWSSEEGSGTITVIRAISNNYLYYNQSHWGNYKEVYKTLPETELYRKWVYMKLLDLSTGKQEMILNNRLINFNIID